MILLIPDLWEMVKALLLGWWAPPVAYLIRREAYLDVGGCDESIRVWEDFDLYLRLAMAGKRHVYVPGLLANYHRYLRTKSLSRRNPKENLVYREKIIQNTVETLKATQQLTSNRCKAAAQALHGIARAAFEYDTQWFDRLIRSAYNLDQEFKPRGTLPYRIFSRLLGLSTTERIALLTRNLRKGRVS